MGAFVWFVQDDVEEAPLEDDPAGPDSPPKRRVRFIWKGAAIQELLELGMYLRAVLSARILLRMPLSLAVLLEKPWESTAPTHEAYMGIAQTMNEKGHFVKASSCYDKFTTLIRFKSVNLAGDDVGKYSASCSSLLTKLCALVGPKQVSVCHLTKNCWLLYAS